MVDVASVREQLEKRLAILGARVGELQDDLRSPHSADFEERATETEGDEVLESLETSALSEIEQIHAALDRIATGVYGRCKSCDEPVGEKRLLALPYATQCIRCADENEA